MKMEIKILCDGRYIPHFVLSPDALVQALPTDEETERKRERERDFRLNRRYAAC